jgi:hypothetical protein
MKYPDNILEVDPPTRLYGFYLWEKIGNYFDVIPDLPRPIKKKVGVL